MTEEYIDPASLFRSLDHGFSPAVAATGKRTLYIRAAVEAGGGSLDDVLGRLYTVD